MKELVETKTFSQNYMYIQIIIIIKKNRQYTFPEEVK